MGLYGKGELIVQAFRRTKKQSSCGIASSVRNIEALGMLVEELRK